MHLSLFAILASAITQKMISLDPPEIQCRKEGSRYTHGPLPFPRAAPFLLNIISDILTAKVIAVIFDAVAILVFERLTL